MHKCYHGTWLVLAWYLATETVAFSFYDDDVKEAMGSAVSQENDEKIHSS